MWLHGFTQTRLSASRFRSILAGSREVWTLDLPGHGDAHHVSGSLDETAALVLDALGATPVDLGGYSFGGRVALHVALRAPARVSRLVTLGASRGIQDPAEREARRRRDEALAAHLEQVGTDVFLDEWLSQPLFATLPPDPAERAARSRDPGGLADSLRRAGTGTQRWLDPLLGDLRSPLLALAGERDLKFRAEAHALAAGVPLGHDAIIERAGHAAHLEEPEATAAAILDFLGRDYDPRAAKATRAAAPTTNWAREE